MRTKLVVAALALHSAGVVSAQSVEPLTQRRVQELAGENGTLACDPFYRSSPERDLDESEYAVIRDCANSLRTAALAEGEKPGSAETTANLITIRVNYKRLSKWGRYASITRKEPNRGAAKEALSGLDTALQRALRAHSLFPQFSATLVLGPSFSTTNSSTGAGDAAKAKTMALGTVLWESRHFGDESIKVVDVSFGGRVGMQPVLTLVERQSDEGEEPAAAPILATHQTAFVWTFGVHVNKQLSPINAETGTFVRSGSALLTATPSLVEQGPIAFVGIPADNGASDNAWFWEVGYEFKMFDTPLAQIHAERGTTRPQFHFSLAWRNDQRFNGGGRLADFDRPEQRMVFRLLIDALQVLDRRSFGEEQRTFTFGFSVEHERSFHRSGPTVPSGTRYMVRGDVNLLKSFTGQKEAAQPTR
jgi:hypothetical protein